MKMTKGIRHTFNDREHATILAALRYWQRVGIADQCPEQDIATNGGKLEEQLWPFEIDELCERINA